MVAAFMFHGMLTMAISMAMTVASIEVPRDENY